MGIRSVIEKINRRKGRVAQESDPAFLHFNKQEMRDNDLKNLLKTLNLT